LIGHQDEVCFALLGPVRADETQIESRLVGRPNRATFPPPDQGRLGSRR
jgi:hypothetical protein